MSKTILLLVFALASKREEPAIAANTFSFAARPRGPAAR